MMERTYIALKFLLDAALIGLGFLLSASIFHHVENLLSGRTLLFVMIAITSLAGASLVTIRRRAWD